MKLPRILFAIALLSATPLYAEETIISPETAGYLPSGTNPSVEARPTPEPQSAPQPAPEVKPLPPPAAKPAPAPVPPPAPSAGETWWENNFRIAGDFRQETAFRIASPQNLTKLKGQARVDLKFIFNDHFKLRLGGRAWADGAYDLTNQYPKPVRSNMRKEVMIRDAYLDMTFPFINMRLGHQQIVWGEALGQAFADVVTPRDLREFNLPSFEESRLPIWALDAQISPLRDFLIELVASPDQQVDKLALQGSDFAFRIPPTPGVETVVQSDDRPSTNFKRWNFGTRFSYLISGWDLAAFYYTSPDHIPAAAKTFSFDPFTGSPMVSLDPIHQRVHHVAATFSKGWNAIIARGEFVYTLHRNFDSVTPTLDRGLVFSNQLRYVLGLDYDISGKALVNAEFQQEVVTNHRSRISGDKTNSWFFLRGSSNLLHNKLHPALTFIVGLNKGDTQISPSVGYDVTDSIVMTAGADVFAGSIDGLYGEFKHQSRVYLNTQWKF